MKRLGMLLMAIVSLAQIQETKNGIETRVYQTARVEEGGINLDGNPVEPAWSKVEWQGDFIQRDPVDGAQPSQQTRFKVLYDNDALYFAFYLNDEADKLSPILARRDHFPGDWIEVNISSYFDGRTAFSFTLSLSGTLGDEYISNNGNNWDSSWDPVWEGKTMLQANGWTAETRIPLSQLRYNKAENLTWGLQVHRRLFRHEERSTWQPIPKTGTGWVSRFGELRGLKGLAPKRQIEILPYSVLGTKHQAVDESNPFSHSSETLFEGGVDGKIGLSKNMTLDFTINPDFGQVEADPSQVNLTSFETFFDEKRPFFIEGKDILDLRISPAVTGGSFTRDNLFYSRRIGKRPSYQPSEDYVDSPDRTRIQGAFKLSGKTANGLSIGILNSMTAEETAAYQTGNEKGRLTVEPRTNYFVGRAQKDFNQGETQVGAIFTAVNRDLEEDYLAFLTREAYAGGVDFSSYFRNRDYRLEASFMMSDVSGSQEAIYQLQTTSARYFQRPDNDSATLDEERTSLKGTAGSVRFSRTSNHNLRFETGTTWRTPGFEINDLGFLREADTINQFTWVGYQITEPFSVFNSLYINANEWVNYDTSGELLSLAGNVNTNMQFKNRSQLGAGMTRNSDYLSNTALRGGPSSKWPGNWNLNFWYNSDSRKRLYGGAGGNWNFRDSGFGRDQNLWMDLYFRPNDSMVLSFQPSWSKDHPEMQYISTENLGGEARYLFGRMEQETYVLTVRFDYSVTPNLTVQYYGSPFTSKGRFDRIKRVTNPIASDISNRHQLFSDDQIEFNADEEWFSVDENEDGQEDYGFSRPDFDYREFQSNLVFRWEYRAGSTLFFVWSQNRNQATLDLTRSGLGQDMETLFSTHPTNVLMLKFSYLFMP